MKALCGIAQVKGAGSTGSQSNTNYRQGYLPNVDAERKPPGPSVPT
ncbi:hypothetical protein [Spirosoma aerophilum]